MAARVEKPYYQFNKGINTEASLIAFPEGFSADEQNYDLLPDGSRRRRKGVVLEAGGGDVQLSSLTTRFISNITNGLVSGSFRRTLTLFTAHEFIVGESVLVENVNGTGTFAINGLWTVVGVPASNQIQIEGTPTTTGSWISGGWVIDGNLLPRASKRHRWESVGGVSDLNFQIIQIGKDLYIYDDRGGALSPNKKSSAISLSSYGVVGATEAQIRESYVDISYGRGHAFVVGRYIEPFVLKYDQGTDSFSIGLINIRERDFAGIEDGISLHAEPTTITAAHRYNLENRGWTNSFITSYFTAYARYPAKSMIAYLGLKRTLTSSNHYDIDGVRVFSPQKLVAELFQDASAPQGHFI